MLLERMSDTLLLLNHSSSLAPTDSDDPATHKQEQLGNVTTVRTERLSCSCPV